MFLDEYQSERGVTSCMSGVYGWMSVALLITASIAYYTAVNPALFAWIMQPMVAMGLVFAQLALVIALAFFITRISFITSLICFLLYASSLGLTLSSIFYIYVHASIFSTFMSCALMFGFMSLYGYYTRSDLTTMGNISFMALIGLVIAMVVNMFLANSQLDYIISIVGVIVFALLTAYDTQKIKRLLQECLAKNELAQKITVIGALTLYLDFINMFLFMLNLFGRRNER